MNIPKPLHDHTRDDAFDRGLELLLHGDPSGIDLIDADLRDTTSEVVRLARDAGWIGAEPGQTRAPSRAWWQRGDHIVNAVAAVFVVGLIAMMVTVGWRVWEGGNREFGSGSHQTSFTETGPGVCSRSPRTDAEIAAIVRKSEKEVRPFQSDGVISNGVTEATQLTRDWNTCLLQQDWRRATAYESEYFIWRIGQDQFPAGFEGIEDAEIAEQVFQRHAIISPLETIDGLNLAVYSADRFRYVPDSNPPLMLGVDAWVVPVDKNGDWIEWFTVMSVEWDGSQWVIVSATRDGIPDSEFFRDDTFPEGTPETTPPQT